MTEEEKNDLIWASGHFLSDNYPEDFDTWSEEKLEKYCEDHTWEMLDGAIGSWLVDQIDHMAWSVREYINAQKK